MLLDKYRLSTTTLFISSLIFFTGCSQKSTWSGSSNGFWGSKTYKDIPRQKIKNSKAMYRATMRPYQIAGKWYYPTLAKVGDVQRGIASWYGPNFHAKRTSNGEIYNMYGMTAAHKTLPMNTMVRVDNLDNGKSTIVRINDRGPFVSGRIIDLSNKAAHEINMVGRGTANVKVTVLGFHAKIAKTKQEKAETATVGKYYVQVGAFRRLEGAKITKRKFEMILEDRYNVVIKEGIYLDEPINRVWVAGFRSQEEATDFKESNGLSSAMIIAE
ncbi:septal ring lytic transglycosylase RlpA family protein [Halarcobacter anaerophilus]|uniref:septal ring lytic transglycosylase RlpA family protein n=1 Tax=Halarcobacter anaerophilus TaxID=877500 RepID=UPI0005CA86EE|nr:septal ring lytic transglycosylase RlpA family protein [Halarcobacter anaerophilus]